MLATSHSLIYRFIVSSLRSQLLLQFNAFQRALGHTVQTENEGMKSCIPKGKLCCQRKRIRKVKKVEELVINAGK